mgnify:FL=1
MKLRRIAARVTSQWLGRDALAGTFLVCETADGMFAILPPEITLGETLITITDETVNHIDVEGSFLVTLNDAVMAAQHATDAAQRQRVLDAEDPEVKH